MTRYPKSGKGGKWTIKELESITQEWKGDTLSDGDSLSGEVRSTKDGEISIRFRSAIWWKGKVAWHYCGTFPTDELAKIRMERDKARELVRNGIDPRASKKAARIEAQAAIEATIRADEQKRIDNKTVADLFELWVKDGVNRSDGNKYIRQSFGKYVLPNVGSIPLSNLTESHLLSIYRSIIESGKTPTAVELSKDVKQMLKWGEKRKPWRALLVEGNPADLVDVGKLVPKDYSKERTRILSVEEIKKLKSVFDQTAENYQNAAQKYGTERPIKREVQIAMWLCLSTLCRIGELLQTEWKHVDFYARTWSIPAANTKGVRGKKRDQIVFLSDFALDQFKQLYELTGDSDWAFPARYKPGHVCIKSASKQIGDRQTKFKQRTRKHKCRVENNSLVLGETEWTPHDLRRTGATMMQMLKIPRDIINLCQSHVIGSKVDRVYLLHEYSDEKREAWEKLGHHLQTIFGEG